MGVPGLNGRTLTQYYVAAYDTPSGPSLIEAMIDAGAPACLRPDPPVAPGDHPRNLLQEDRLRCPAGQAWLSGHFVAALAAHLATHPRAAHRYFSDALGDESVLRSDGRTAVPVVIPGALDDVFFSPRPGSADPLVVWWLAGIGAVGIWCCVLPHTRPRRPVPFARNRRGAAMALLAGRSPLQVGTAFTLAAAGAALVGTALLSASDASRVALPVTVLIRLVLIVVVIRATVSVARTERARSAARARASHQPALPGSPLKGPVTLEVIQPP